MHVNHLICNETYTYMIITKKGGGEKNILTALNNFKMYRLINIHNLLEIIMKAFIKY